jgi:hypothetical protein
VPIPALQLYAVEKLMDELPDVLKKRKPPDGPDHTLYPQHPVIFKAHCALTAPPEPDASKWLNVVAVIVADVTPLPSVMAVSLKSLQKASTTSTQPEVRLMFVLTPDNN